MSSIANAEENLVRFDVDEKVFPRQVSVAAAYRFLDRCYVLLERAGRGKLAVSLKGKKKMAKAGLSKLADEFDNELLHQLMRHQVSAQTDGLREVLVGRALLSAEPVEAFEQENALLEADDADLDYLDDPLGIAVPWEEKYGDNQGKDDKSEEGQGEDDQGKDDQGKDDQGKDGQGKDDQGKDGQS